jgi:hypothetical protein
VVSSRLCAPRCISCWHFRKQHTINAASGAGTGYQVRVNVHYLNGTDNGADVYLGGKCKGDGTHDLVFLWTCGAGGDNRTGTNCTDDPWGMASCWMHLDANSTLGRDGYAANETNNCGRCFIGFDYLSKWFTDGTGHNNASYAQFANLFFYYLMRDNNTVRDALDRATHDVRGVDHLYEWTMPKPEVGHFYNLPGYDIWDPHLQTWMQNRIRIWGDGDMVIPHN